MARGECETSDVFSVNPEWGRVAAARERRASSSERESRMRGSVGCWSLVAVTGLAGLFPNLCYLAHAPGTPVRPRALPPPPVCLEAWVRLRSYRGCPVLAAGNGYRLGIYCFPGGCSGPAGSSNGALVLAGPFPGQAYISERPVPLGRWVHLAGLEGSAGWPPPATAPISATPATAATWETSATSATSATWARSAIVAIDGIDVTAGRMSGGAADPLALGYDPWEARLQAARAATAARSAMAAMPAIDSSAATAAQAPATVGHRRAADCAGLPGPPDGERGAWRWSRAWRSLSQVAAARGTPRRLELLAPSASARPAALRMPGNAGPGGVTARGWRILASGLLLALAMAGAGMALRRRDGGAARDGDPLARWTPEPGGAARDSDPPAGGPSGTPGERE